MESNEFLVRISMDSSEDKQSKSKSGEAASSTSTKPVTNLCIICSQRQRALAFVPCGHFGACVPCGHGLKSCPTCSTKITALLRIYD